MVFLDPIIDNQEHSLRDTYKKLVRRSEEVRIATGYFYLSGFNLYKEDLEELADPEELGKSPIRIIMGRKTDRRTADELEEGFNLREQMEDDIHEDIEQLNNAQMDRLERLKDFIAEGLVDVRISNPDGGSFHAKGASFREPLTEGEKNVEDQDRRPVSVIVGSSNFSETGHTKNIELNLSSQDATKAAEFEGWFDNRWANSEEFNQELIEIIESNPKYQDWKEDQEETEGEESEELELGTFIEPFEYYKMLAYDALDGYVSDRHNSPLYHFQHRGYESAKAKLAKYDGAIISDSVGLGKSFIGAEILRDYRHNGLNALLIVPAHLTNQWEELLEEATDETGNKYFNLEVDDRHLEVMSITKFQNLEYERVQELREQFDAVLVDEAHRFRNSGRWKPGKEDYKGTRRYANLREFKDKKMIMLTATPLNNSAEDLKNLISLFTNEKDLRNIDGLDFDAFDEYIKLASKRKKMIREDEVDQQELQKILDQLADKAEEIGNILDSVMVLRTRKHVKEQLREEEDFDMNFKPPEVHKENYTLPDAYQPAYEVLPDIMNALHLPHITIRNPQGGSTLKALYKLNLLKRLESSPYAFIMSLQTLYESETKLLDILEDLPEDEKVRELQELQDEDKVVLEDFTQNEETAEGLQSTLEELGFDDSVARQGDDVVDDLEKAEVGDVIKFIREDLAMLSHFASQFVTGIAPQDEELNDLKHTTDNWLREKGLNKIPDVPPTKYDEVVYPGTDLEDAVEELEPFYNRIFDIQEFKDTKVDRLAKVLNKQDGKTIIFTQYRATADYIYDQLLDSDESPMTRENSAVVKGGDKNKQDVVKRFSPGSTGYQSTLDEEGENELDYVVATDTLSEGVNLQDVNTAINYDLPWNPMRIVQRVGRIDRIGSTADKHVHNFFPDEDLETAIKLLERLQAKIDDIALIVGKENNILDPNEDEVLDRAGVEKEKTIGEIELEEIQESVQKSREVEDINELDDTSQNALLRRTGKESEKEAFRRVKLKQELQDKYDLEESDFEFAEDYFETQPEDREQLYTVLNEDNISEASVLALMHIWYENSDAPLNRAEREVYYTSSHKDEVNTINSVRQINISKYEDTEKIDEVDETLKNEIELITEKVDERTGEAEKSQVEGAYKEGGKKSKQQEMVLEYLERKIIPEEDHLEEQAQEILNRLKHPNLKNTEEGRELRSLLGDQALTDWDTQELLNELQGFVEEFIQESPEYQSKLAKKSEVNSDTPVWAVVR